jgi:hypothetical protein
MTKSIYKDFCEHTGLKDSVYESVFFKIFETLGKLNDIQWLYLTYTDKDTDSTSVINFKKEKTVPLYIVELIKNAFGNYYTLPKSVVVTLNILYKDQEYNIICNNEEIVIPDELQFLKTGNLFNMFFLTHPVRDIFEEYDNIFSFMNEFKPVVKRVLPALEKKFDVSTSKEMVDQEIISSKDVMNNKLLVEALEEQIENYMKQISDIKLERDNLEAKRQSAFSSVSNRGELVAEKNKLINEHETLRKMIEEYDDRLEKLDKIIEEIDSQVRYSIDRNGPEEERTFFKDKRIIFDHDRMAIEKTKQDVLRLIKTSEVSIDQLNRELKTGEQLTDQDLKNMEIRVAELNNLQDSTYAELLRDDSKLKSLKASGLNTQLKIEKAKTYADMTIQTIETGSIVSQLAAPMQPVSVTTVYNYLRNYFCYYVTLISNEISKEAVNENIYFIQAIATRKVLFDIFGLSFNTFFSVFSPVEYFKLDNVKNTILITKE